VDEKKKKNGTGGPFPKKNSKTSIDNKGEKRDPLTHSLIAVSRGKGNKEYKNEWLGAPIDTTKIKGKSGEQTQLYKDNRAGNRKYQRDWKKARDKSFAKKPGIPASRKDGRTGHAPYAIAKGSGRTRGKGRGSANEEATALEWFPSRRREKRAKPERSFRRRKRVRRGK